MTQNLTYSTGMVVGMTGISFQSLYRYVRAFSEFFTERVKSHARGRRWTDSDVVLAQSIQALFDRRAGPDGVRQALQDGYRLDNSPEQNPMVLEAFSSVYEACQLYREQAVADRQIAHDISVQFAKFTKHVRDDHALLVNLEKKLLDHEEEITRLRTKRSFISFGR